MSPYDQWLERNGYAPGLFPIRGDQIKYVLDYYAEPEIRSLRRRGIALYFIGMALGAYFTWLVMS